MVKIAPSLLSADFTKIEEEMNAVVEAGADMIHLDVMDGVFAPNLTFGPAVIQSFNKPKGVEFDAHLMITHPENIIETFFNIGLDRIAIHVESTIHLHRLLRLIRDNGIMPAVAINPSTSLSSVEWILEEVGMVVIMTVNPGFSGQSFIEAMLPKIETLKEMITKKGLNIEIQVDGGISVKNIRRVIDAGMDIAVGGSSVYGQDNYVEAIRALKSA